MSREPWPQSPHFLCPFTCDHMRASYCRHSCIYLSPHLDFEFFERKHSERLFCLCLPMPSQCQAPGDSVYARREKRQAGREEWPLPKAGRREQMALSVPFILCTQDTENPWPAFRATLLSPTRSRCSLCPSHRPLQSGQLPNVTPDSSYWLFLCFLPTKEPERSFQKKLLSFCIFYDLWSFFMPASHLVVITKMCDFLALYLPRLNAVVTFRRINLCISGASVIFTRNCFYSWLIAKEKCTNQLIGPQKFTK